jgi:hypothetical protein
VVSFGEEGRRETKLVFRCAGDKLVEHAHPVELLDPQYASRITKTDYRCAIDKANCKEACSLPLILVATGWDGQQGIIHPIRDWLPDPLLSSLYPVTAHATPSPSPRPSPTQPRLLTSRLPSLVPPTSPPSSAPPLPTSDRTFTSSPGASNSFLLQASPRLSRALQI